MSGGDDSHGRRYPHSLEGLLQMSVETSGSEVAPNETESVFANMSEERKEFLQGAIASFCENSELEQMKKCLKVLSQSDASDDDEQLTAKENALECLVLLVDIIDNANDLQKIGGFPIVAQYLKNSLGGLRWRAADVVAAVSQNNPYSQAALTEMEIIPVLVTLLDSDSDEQVRIKALYAMSCLTRDFPAAEKAFIDQDGFSVLMRAMHGDADKLKLKAAFMLRHLLYTTDQACKDTLVSMGMVEQLASLLQALDEDYQEHIINALLLLATDNPKAIAECGRAELGIKAALESKIQSLQENNADNVFEDEISYCKDLLRLCFSDQCQNEDNGDR